MSNESPDSPPRSNAEVTRGLTAAEVRATRFSGSKRGYERAEVDRFREGVADLVGELEARMAEIDAMLGRLGIVDLGQLKIEMDAVGKDVSTLLTAAEEAATGIRTRAAADAAKWRADAEQSAAESTSEATAQAETLRAEAWEAASQLAEQTRAEHEQLLEAARQDALFIRAEAEREALRLTGDARRDAEEAMRAARAESDRRVAQARAEAEEVLETARQAAEQAQERARALEQRRVELMEELESARLSIGQLEQEIDHRKEELAGVKEAEPGGAGEPSPLARDALSWHEDEGSVRVVPAHAVVEEPVDADSLAAEVEALRRSIEEVSRPEGAPGDMGPADDAEIGALEPEAELPGASGVEETVEPEPSAAEAEPAAEEPELEVEALPPEPAVDESELEVEAPEPEHVEPSPGEDGAEPEEPAVREVVPPSSSELGGLFASLRSPQPSPPATEAPAEPDVVEPGAEQPESGIPPVIEAMETATAQPGVDAFEVRDRLLLPIENKSLRDVKRSIVDLQNLVLEELRVEGEGWTLDRDEVAAALDDELSKLTVESYVAGFTGAGELTGAATPPVPVGTANGRGVEAVAAALGDAIGEALERTRITGGGSRAGSSAVGRVFRAWRTDEAERRVRRLASTAYHRGLLGALAGLGVARVAAVERGVPCGRCPAGRDVTWAPGGALPHGTELPPATSTCSATIVPVAEPPEG